jgi:hypothetical protein
MESISTAGPFTAQNGPAAAGNKNMATRQTPRIDEQHNLTLARWYITYSLPSQSFLVKRMRVQGRVTPGCS